MLCDLRFKQVGKENCNMMQTYEPCVIYVVVC